MSVSGPPLALAAVDSAEAGPGDTVAAGASALPATASEADAARLKLAGAEAEIERLMRVLEA